MTILGRKVGSGGTVEIVNGSARLRAMLELTGRATITNIHGGEKLHVHEVGDKTLVLNGSTQAKVEELADDIISNAKQGKLKPQPDEES